MFSEKIETLLNIQANHELYNANFYLQLYTYFKELNLDGFAKIFKAHQEEELQHNNMIIEFLTDLGKKYSIDTVQAPNIQVESLLEDETAMTLIAVLRQQLEMDTTAYLNNIAKEALAENDFLTLHFIQSMLDIQRQELLEADEFLMKCKLVQGDFGAIQLWNEKLLG